jgi:hypothetical protein
MRRIHDIFPKPEEGTFTYALLLARVSLRKIPPNTAIDIRKYAFIHSERKIFWDSLLELCIWIRNGIG